MTSDNAKVAEDIGNCVRQNVPWQKLPIILRQVLHNETDYEKFIFNYSLKNQLRFRGNLVSKVFRHEQRYYELLVQKSINGLCLFPYHLSDVVTKGLRVTPFNYYLDVLSQLLRNDKSYDTLPNFTAADCLRVLGIGRNEYLSLISDLKTHSIRTLIFSSKPNPLEFLPRFPIRIRIEPWWRVEIGYVLETDIRYVNAAERSLIDDLIDFGSQTASKCDYEIVHSLYRKGLIYLDVPISGEDRISIPPLRNFVMNRISGDYFENLLYKIFVSADEHMTISELSHMLQVDLDTVKQAVSFFCRLGFARLKESVVLKNNDQLSTYHASWEKYKEDQFNLQERVPQITPLTYNSTQHQNESNEPGTPNAANLPQTPNIPQGNRSSNNTNNNNNNNNNSNAKNNGNANDSRESSSIGYLSSDGNTSDFSFALPSPLSSSTGANRNSPEELELISEIDDLSESTTKQSIKALTVTVTTATTESAVSASTKPTYLDQQQQLKHLEKTGKRVGFLFDSTLTAFLMMGNLSPGLKNHAVTMFEVGKLCEESLDTFLAELEKVSLLDAEGEGDVTRYFAHAVILRSTICSLRNLVPGGLDLLRLECLECLDQKTRDRILEKKYKFIISATPLTATLSHLFNIPFFGQFFRSSDSSHMWTKLFYNHITGYGPPSLFLCRGTVLKTLPRIFLGYGKLLVNILHSDSYIINSENFRNLNDQLKNGCVLIQGYGIRSPGELRYESFPFNREDPRRFIWANHKAVQKLSEHLDLERLCGYITFLNTGVPDIGCETYEFRVRLQHPKSKTKPNNPDVDVSKNHYIKSTSTALSSSVGNGRDEREFERNAIIKTNMNLNSPTENVCTATITTTITTTTTTTATTTATQNSLTSLKSPDENYFAVTPQNGSPSNVFTSADCNELLATELAKCDIEIGNNVKGKADCETVPNRRNSNSNKFGAGYSAHAELVSQGSIEIPLSKDSLLLSRNDNDEDVHENAVNEYDDTIEEWTLLDVNFGVPLFDVDANTRICEQIVHRLCNDENLEALPSVSAAMNEKFLDFIQQCLYFEDEQHENFKIGKVLPHPRVNLAFENGHVCYWTGR